MTVRFAWVEGLFNEPATSLRLSHLYAVRIRLPFRRGGLERLALYILLAWSGFWIGQFLAVRLGWTFGSLGPLHLGMATLVSLAFLGIGYWLSLVEVERR
jgi:hypothetical protein